MLIILYDTSERMAIDPIIKKLKDLHVAIDRQVSGKSTPGYSGPEDIVTELQKTEAEYRKVYENIAHIKYERLTTPQLGYKRGIRLAKEAPAHLYYRMSREVKTEENERPLIVDPYDIDLGPYPMTRSQEYDYRQWLKKQAPTFDPSSAVILFNSEKLEDYVVKEIVEGPLRRVKGTKYEDPLRKEIHQLMLDSPFGSDENPVSEQELHPRLLGTDYMRLYHSKISDELAAASSRDLTVSKETGRAFYDNRDKDFSLMVDGYEKMKGSLGPSVHKLLTTAIVYFTSENSGNDHEEIKYDVRFPFDQYADRLGYDLKKPENVKSARKRIKEDLEILAGMKMDWNETINGSPKGYVRVNPIDSVYLKGNTIGIRFGLTFSQYLVHHPLTEYPTALLGITGRNPNAYSIGDKLALHYTMKPNKEKGTNDRLRVSTLLKAASDIPDIEEVRNERHSWSLCIRKPFEKAMDSLKDYILDGWDYMVPGSGTISRKEADAINDYETWAGLLVRFYMKKGNETENGKSSQDGQ